MNHATWFLLLAAHTVYSQTDTSAAADSATRTAIKAESFGIINSGVAAMQTVPQVTSQDFNAGNIHDPLQLIQGKFPEY